MEPQAKHAPSNDSAEIWAQDEYHFHGQRAKEHVMLVRNQHFLVLTPKILIAVITLVIPYLLIKFPSIVTTYGLVIYGIVFLYWVGHHLYSYRQSVSIITNERIISVLQRGFFNAKITEAELNRIQDVSSDIKGVLQTAFGFGDVTIRTASESLLVLVNVPKPYDVQQAIVRALKETKSGD